MEQKTENKSLYNLNDSFEKMREMIKKEKKDFASKERNIREMAELLKRELLKNGMFEQCDELVKELNSMME
ncbi:hypothetical protein [Helicobacter turcicus]|uniref:Uncharacterized protein n=1 Tax=Helicobacter turcicus TaxID=2867412 RepID=A0ABS7JQC4_9HELI|nr:hypothetical protein [Helicobacter turcicus]MBX7491570.1 hypothetical protein [Helicobacter turcicus]MBX7546419.1 hypothetical protein [Helicobacter turcicus]